MQIYMKEMVNRKCAIELNTYGSFTFTTLCLILLPYISERILKFYHISEFRILSEYSGTMEMYHYAIKQVMEYY